jgi:hypothetical protein
MVAADDHRRGARGENSINGRFDRGVGRLDADRRRIHVTGVDDGQRLEGRDLLKYEYGRMSDDWARISRGAEPRARAIRRAAVEGDAQHRDIDAGENPSDTAGA